MSKKILFAIILLLLIVPGIYLYKDTMFLKDTASEVNSFSKEMLTKYVTFKKDTPESVILGFKVSLESRDEVESVTYVSLEQGLQDFKNRYPEASNDTVTMQAASETILPKLKITLKSDNGGANTKTLKDFIGSSTVDPYIDSF